MVEANKPCSAVGTSPLFASPAVLAAVESGNYLPNLEDSFFYPGEDYVPSASDDLHSFVRTVFFLVSALRPPQLLGSTDPLAIRSFWASVAAGDWHDYFNAADLLDYHTLALLVSGSSLLPDSGFDLAFLSEFIR